MRRTLPLFRLFELEAMSQESAEKERKPIDVYEFLGVMLEQISSIAWQKLGLQPDIITGKLEPDLAQAKTAIDVTAELVKAIESQLDDEDKRRVQGLVRDLRVNWVHKNTEASN